VILWTIGKKVHRVLAGSTVTFCGKWSWHPYYVDQPEGEICLRCTAVAEGRYVCSVALGLNENIRR
jgi:hypothetical protein